MKYLCILKTSPEESFGVGVHSRNVINKKNIDKNNLNKETNQETMIQTGSLFSLCLMHLKNSCLVICILSLIYDVNKKNKLSLKNVSFTKKIY